MIFGLKVKKKKKKKVNTDLILANKGALGNAWKTNTHTHTHQHAHSLAAHWLCVRLCGRLMLCGVTPVEPLSNSHMGPPWATAVAHLGLYGFTQDSRRP